jgi:hypothetical protein
MERRSPTGFEDAHAEGAAAYATRQATLYEDLAAEFERMWADLRDLEVVQGEEIVAVQSDVDEDGADDDEDADDGVEGEDGSEDEQIGDNEEEGSVGGALDDGEDE